MKEWKLGVYVQPDAVAADPDYAKRLVEEAGVDHFVLRAGYDLVIPAALEAAIAVVKDVKAQACCMAGTWWYPEMEILDLPYKSFEGQYPMTMPGGALDAGIAAKLEKLCGQYKADAVCLSHARYRHPAHIEGIYNDGAGDSAYMARMEKAGVTRAEVLAARAAVERALASSDKAALMKASEDGLIPFLSNLSGGDALDRYFAFRRGTVMDAFRTFHQAVKKYDGATFGTNAYSPIGFRVCGQDYDAFAETCEFVQPLFPYMEYHHLQPIAAWARYVRRHAGLDDASAIEIARRLLYLGDATCPESIEELDTCGEGDDKTVASIVGKEVQLCAPYASKPYRVLPVIRGQGWGRPVIDRLTEEIKSLYDGIVYMGCDYLVPGSQAPDGWF